MDISICIIMRLIKFLFTLFVYYFLIDDAENIQCNDHKNFFVCVYRSVLYVQKQTVYSCTQTCDPLFISQVSYCEPTNVVFYLLKHSFSNPQICVGDLFFRF